MELSPLQLDKLHLLAFAMEAQDEVPPDSRGGAITVDTGNVAQSESDPKHWKAEIRIRLIILLSFPGHDSHH